MWQLNKAELGKIFLRPAVYIMIAVLTLVLIICTLCFNPTTRNSNLTNFGTGTSTVSDIFNIFDSSETETYAKKQLDIRLNNAKNNIENFASSTTPSSQLITETNAIKTAITQIPSKKDNKNDLINCMINIKTSAINCLTTLTTLSVNKDLDFYITQKDFNNLKSYYKNLQIEIVGDTQLNSYTLTELQTLAKKIINNYLPDSQLNYLNTVKKVNITPQIKSEITEKYYNSFVYSNGSETILTKIYDNLTSYVATNATLSGEDKRLEINKLITEYKNAVLIGCELLNTSFELEKTSGLSNLSLINYIGFEKSNVYNLKENLALNNYLMQNSIYDGDYLLNFNFSKTSGIEANAYDFTFYAMQVVSIIITIFALFFAVSITAGDFQNGTIKMLATRPITRNNIISGKFFACINFTIIFLIFSVIASMIIGFSLFGLSSSNVLAIVNATSVISVPPVIMLLVLLLSQLINIIFYLVIAFFLATVFRSNIFSMFVTFGIYFFGLLFNSTSASATWFTFTPYAHLDLFKYFGNANVGSTFLGMNLTAGANAIISTIIILIFIIVLDFLTKYIFEKRDIA